jgi:CNT family concentrative nucleoside transporter
VTQRLISALGLLAMMGLAWLISENRRKMNFRLIVSGVALQFVMGVVLISTPLREPAFAWAKKLMDGLMACTQQGAAAVFGADLATSDHFAFSGLPMIIFFSSLTAVLFHLRILQMAVKLMAHVMVWVMDVAGAESLCASGNVLLGMTTAPLMVRPYLPSMTRSEIMAMMTGGMATAAGSTLPVYVAYGADPGHLFIASIMSAPASLVIAKIMVPETEDSPTKGRVSIEVERPDVNMLDAACRGATEGLKLMLNVGAMLIAFIALVTLINWMLTPTAYLFGEPLTLQQIFGWIFAPLAWIIGVEWKDASTIGTVLGEKTVVNEIVAFIELGKYKAALSPRSFTIATYALCGFANFGSIAVMIGGIGGLAPKRRTDFARYGLRSMIGGTLAAMMTAAIAGMLI